LNAISRHRDSLTYLKLSNVCIGETSGALAFVVRLFFKVREYRFLEAFELEGFIADNHGTVISFGSTDSSQNTVMGRIQKSRKLSRFLSTCGDCYRYRGQYWGVL